MSKFGYFSKSNGLTLIEMLIALALLSIVLGIGYTVLDMNYDFTSAQLRESGRRNDVLTASNYLTADIRNSRSLSIPAQTRIEIVDKDNVNIIYYMYENAGYKYLVRQKSGKATSFKDIQNTRFILENDKLVSARFYTDTANNKYTDYKVSKMSFAYKPPDAEPTFIDFVTEQNVFVYGNVFSSNGASINGPDSTIFIKGDLLTNNLNGGSSTAAKQIYVNGSIMLDGGSADLGLSNNSGSIYVSGNMSVWNGTRDIYGTVYVKGDFRLKDAIIHGTVYVDGNVELGWTPTLEEGAHIYYTGVLSKPDYYDSDGKILPKCIKVSTVPTFVTPEFVMPGLRDSTWYSSNGYVSGGALQNNTKIFSDNYNSDSHIDSSNVIIASTKDITLNGWRNVSGVLFAPYGKVNFGGASFTGTIIARDGVFVTSGGSTINSRDIDAMITDPKDYPFPTQYSN